MKKEELIKFQTEFEKKRRQGVRRLWYQVPLIVLLTLIIIAMLLAILWISQDTNLKIQGQNQNLFWLVYFIVVMGSVLFIVIYVLPSVFIKEFDVGKLRKNEDEKLQGYLKQKSDLQSELETAENHAKKSQGFVTWMQNPEITIIAPDPIWPQYIIGVAKANKENLEKLKKRDEELDENISEHQEKIDFYDQVKERNFWQYLRSGKWFKKVKGEKNEYD